MNNPSLIEHFKIVKESSLFKEYYAHVSEESNIPVIDKHDLSTILNERFDLQAESKGVYLVRSGGSSAKPLIYPVDIKENLYQRELLAIELLKYGLFTPKTIALNLFSYSDMYRSAAIMDDLMERCDATTIPVGSKSRSDLMYNLALKFKANMIIGTSF